MRDQKSISREYYDKLAPNYDQHSHARYLEKLYDEIVATANEWSFDSALDVGCGTGSLLAMLKDGCEELAGADISAEMIEEAKKRLGEDVDLKVADSENLPWRDNSFALVVCTGSFHHYPAPLKALSEMRRVLKKDGHLIIADPRMPFPMRQLANLFVRFSREGAVRLYTEAELGGMMREVGFTEVRRLEVSIGAIVMSAAANKD
jgi:ubiquinone/menaquinone biosynthesis C-methylase UbiE